MLAAAHPTPATSLSLAQAFAAGRGALTVGRTEDNQLSAIALNAAAPQQLPDKLVNMVSRRHARLEVVAGQLELADLGAVNGTYVNDARIESGSRRVLQENDMISLGGPSTIAIHGSVRPNPWVWRVRQLHEFLAAYVPPSQGPPPAVPAAAAAPAAAAGPPPGREMYSFSPAPAQGAADAGAGGAAQAAGERGAQPPGPTAPSDEEVESPGGALPGGVGSLGQWPIGSIPVGSPRPAEAPAPAPALALLAAAAGAPAAAAAPAPGAQAAAQAAEGPRIEELLPEDSDELAELAALEAWEASQRQQAQPAAPQPAPQPPRPVAQPQWQPPPVPAPVTAQQQVAPAAQPRPQARQRPAVRVEPEVVDLTGDSPSPSPTSPPRHRPQQQQRLAVAGSSRAPGPAAAAVGGSGGADVVDLLDSSPTKRRHAADAEQGAKRARPSPDAHMQRPAAAPAVAVGTAPAVSPPAPAATAGPAAAGPAASEASGLDELHDSAPVCAICQELPVVTHSMVPCGHSFCGECLAGWLSKKSDCPTCRVAGTAKPVRNHDMDRMIGALAAMGARAGTLSADDVEARREKQAAWDSKKAELERALAAPWERSGRRSGGGGVAAAAAGPAGILYDALLPSMLLGGLGGGLGGFGADPLGLLMPAPFALPGGGGGGPRRRAPQVVPPPVVPPRPAAPPQQEYRTEVSAQGSASRCTACGGLIGELTVRIGMRPAAQRSGAWRWHHLACLPPAYWHEARLRGVANLRGIPPADQARVREHLRTRS